MRRFALLAACLACFGCAQFPELDAAVSASANDAGFPTLVPLDTLLARADAPMADAVAVAGNLAARTAALRARAARLKRPVVDPQTRARMDAAVRRHAS